MGNLLLPKYRRGDLVRVLCVPPAIERCMPGAYVTLLRHTVGKTLRVDAVGGGLLMLLSGVMAHRPRTRVITPSSSSRSL